MGDASIFFLIHVKVDVLDSLVPKPMNTKNACDMYGLRLVRLSCLCRTPTQIRAPKRRANKVSYESESCHLSHCSPARNQTPGLWSWPKTIFVTRWENPGITPSQLSPKKACQDCICTSNSVDARECTAMQKFVKNINLENLKDVYIYILL